MILRERVGGDGRLKRCSSSGAPLDFLLPLETARLVGLVVVVESNEHVALGVMTLLEDKCPWSAADCNAGGGRARFDSEDEDVHGLSWAAISVEAAGVGGRTGEGILAEVVSAWLAAVFVDSSCEKTQMRIWVEIARTADWKAVDGLVMVIESAKYVRGPCMANWACARQSLRKPSAAISGHRLHQSAPRPSGVACPS
jgi:hypothetical protein